MIRAFLTALLIGAAAAPRLAAAQQPVELELLLAVDTSSSVDRAEFGLQMRGIARAFRHPDVTAALRAVGEGGIAVALMQWASHDRQAIAVDWMRVDDDASALAFADAVDAAPRLVLSGGTALGTALDSAAAELQGNAFAGARKAIDISGDGRANMGLRPPAARDRAVAQGITVNALAILNEAKALDRYYLERVIGGPSAFVMTAAGYDSFAAAIQRKLVREITGAPIVRAPGPADSPAPRLLAGR